MAKSERLLGGVAYKLRLLGGVAHKLRLFRDVSSLVDLSARTSAIRASSRVARLRG